MKNTITCFGGKFGYRVVNLSGSGWNTRKEAVRHGVEHIIRERATGYKAIVDLPFQQQVKLVFGAEVYAELFG